MADDPVNGTAARWLWILLTALTAILVSETHLERGNTLHANGAWKSSKTDLDRGVVGAVAFMITRVPLHHDRLNLGAWHGFQQVMYRHTLDLRGAEFAFRLEPDAYLSFILDENPVGFSGLRLSRNDAFPSRLFTATAEGAFLESSPIALAIGGGWHHCAVSFQKGTVAVDGSPVATIPAHTGPRTVGFRGGFRESLVDDVRLHPAHGAPIVERFRNTRGYVVVLLVALIATLAVQAATLTAMRWTVGFSAPLPFHGVLVALSLTVIAAGLFGAERLVLGKRYPTEIVMDLSEYRDTIESERDVLERLRRLPRTTRPRVLFLGTSQTWGAGAARDRDTFVRRIERALGVECINAGVPGAQSTFLLEHYRAEWVDLGPRVTVVDLANNDSDGRMFTRSLVALVELNQARGIGTVFVLEPNSTEYDERRPLEFKHAVMRRVASRMGVPVVDMDAYLAAHHDDGFLWWDHVHLTSFGQRLFTDRLVPEIRAVLDGDGRAPGP